MRLYLEERRSTKRPLINFLFLTRPHLIRLIGSLPQAAAGRRTSPGRIEFLSISMDGIFDVFPFSSPPRNKGLFTHGRLSPLRRCVGYFQTDYNLNFKRLDQMEPFSPLLYRPSGCPYLLSHGENLSCIRLASFPAGVTLARFSFHFIFIL